MIRRVRFWPIPQFQGVASEFNHLLRTPQQLLCIAPRGTEESDTIATRELPRWSGIRSLRTHVSIRRRLPHDITEYHKKQPCLSKMRPNYHGYCDIMLELA